MKAKPFFILTLFSILPYTLPAEERLPPGLKFSSDRKPLISPVDAPFELKINVDGYALKQAKLKDGGRGVYFMFTGDDSPNLSIWVETPGHCPNLLKCKDIVASELRQVKNLKSYQKKQFYIFEYVQDLGSMKMAHLRIQAFIANYWIDMHVSVVNGKVSDLIPIIDNLEFSDVPAK